jgi:hypothetical protein
MKNHSIKKGPENWVESNWPVPKPDVRSLGLRGSEPFIEVTKRLLPDGSNERKSYPITTGFIDYFPDAIAAVAEVSYIGNQKHNPGQPTHWARGKSMDHADCIGRHLIQRGTWDTSGPVNVRHTALLAWRALALLQEELERDLGLSTPRGAEVPTVAFAAA